MGNKLIKDIRPFKYLRFATFSILSALEVRLLYIHIDVEYGE